MYICVCVYRRVTPSSVRFIYMCVRGCLCVCLCMYMCMCMYVYVRVRAYVCMNVCVVFLLSMMTLSVVVCCCLLCGVVVVCCCCYSDFRRRIAHYEEVYETIDDDDVSYIKLKDVGVCFVCTRIAVVGLRAAPDRRGGMFVCVCACTLWRLYIGRQVCAYRSTQ